MNSSSQFPQTNLQDWEVLDLDRKPRLHITLIFLKKNSATGIYLMKAAFTLKS